MEKHIYDQVLQFETHMHKHTDDQYLTISHRSVWVKVQTSNTMKGRGNYVGFYHNIDNNLFNLP